MRNVASPSQLPEGIRRVCVVGTSGCGKSFFARELSARTGAAHVELDGLHWKDGWVEATDEEYRRRFEEALGLGRWILDGNYGLRESGGLQARAFEGADLVVWLDLPMRTVLRRVTVRSVRRAATRERLWGTNNHETFRGLLASRYSMPLWVVRTFGSRRRQYEELLGGEAFPGTAVVRVRSGREAMRWVEAVARVFGAE